MIMYFIMSRNKSAKARLWVFTSQVPFRRRIVLTNSLACFFPFSQATSSMETGLTTRYFKVQRSAAMFCN